MAISSEKSFGYRQLFLKGVGTKTVNHHSEYLEWVVKPFNAPNVVLSVGRILNPALAVQYLNPELPPPHTKSGVFFACDLLLARVFFAFVRQFHPVCEHGVRLFQAHALWRGEQLDGHAVAPLLADV